jgi:hypothetical protein
MGADFRGLTPIVFGYTLNFEEKTNRNFKGNLKFVRMGILDIFDLHNI